jgi:anti-sigma-K factor RskA
MNGNAQEPEAPREGCGLDVAAYSLGALDAAEAKTFEAHLQTCTMCREELAEFASVIATLPASVPAHRSPASLRRRVMEEVNREAQSGARSPARRAPRLGWLAMPRPALALGAAMAVIAVAVFAGVQLGGAGPQKRIYNAQVTGVTGTAQVEVTGNHGELIVHHLTPPPQGKIYEVWLARPHRRPQPTTALFGVTTNGNGDVVVPGSLRGVSGVMVTPEPAGGSQTPTHAPVIQAQLT